MTTRDDLEAVKRELERQLKYEHIDWDYFSEYVDKARALEEQCNKECL